MARAGRLRDGDDDLRVAHLAFGIIIGRAARNKASEQQFWILFAAATRWLAPMVVVVVRDV